MSKSRAWRQRYKGILLEVSHHGGGTPYDELGTWCGYLKLNSVNNPEILDHLGTQDAATLWQIHPVRTIRLRIEMGSSRTIVFAICIGRRAARICVIASIMGIIQMPEKHIAAMVTHSLQRIPTLNLMVGVDAKSAYESTQGVVRLSAKEFGDE